VKNRFAFQENPWHLACSVDGVPLRSSVPIALVMSSFDAGGTERQMLELIRRLDRSRWNVTVACLRNTGAWRDRVAAPTVSFPLRSFASIDAAVQARAFARWCSTRRVAIVHTVDTPANIFGLPAAAWAGVPVRIGTRRDINPGRRTRDLLLQRAAYGCAHGIAANADAVRQRLRAERVPAERITVIPNGLDAERFTAERDAHPIRRGIIVANLRREKGHDVLIDAARAVLTRYPDAHFDVVGDGIEREALLARAAARGVSHAFAFLGHSDDVGERLGAADFFVLPSRSEAFPNAVLEAMASGLPVVASKVGGIAEAVDDGRTGLLVAPGDPDALARSIVRLMSEPDLASRLGRAARADVRERYSFDRMVAAFDHLYASLLERRGVALTPEPRLASL
jgi:glycosyltransferase involved in cell wall biosynthesis